MCKHTQGDTLYSRSLGIRKVPVNLFNDFLFHLGDGVAVQHLHWGYIRTFAVDHHLQSLRGKEQEPERIRHIYTDGKDQSKYSDLT